MLGHPVRHTLSPLIQNAAFAAAGMNAIYVALDVPGPRLAEALRGLHAAHVKGLNLTSPHKEMACALASEQTPEAAEAQAMNTLAWRDEGWRGHATDGIGFLAWVREAGIRIEGRRVLLLGAGGAARSVLPKLLPMSPAEVRVVSRNRDRAEALARAGSRGRARKPRVSFAGLEDEIEARARGWDLLVRCLAVETVSPPEDRWWNALSREAVVLDLNYGGRVEGTRARALADGLRFEDGLMLLVHQGAASFEFWTGSRAPLDAMRGTLRERS